MTLIKTNMERIKKYVKPYWEHNNSFLITKGQHLEVSMIHRNPDGEYFLNFNDRDYYEDEWDDNLFDEISFVVLWA